MTGSHHGSRTGEVVRIVALWRAGPDTVDEVRAILRELAVCTAREPGCLRFEVLESTGAPGRFVLLEEYAGDQGRRNHLETEHFRRLVPGRAVGLLTERDVQAYRPMPMVGEGSIA